MVKRVNAIQTTDTINLIKKADNNTNFCEIEKKMLDVNHDKYSNTQNFKNFKQSLALTLNVH